MTADEFRKLALEVPGAVEKAHMNHPDFRLHNKIFASLGEPNESCAMVKLTSEQQRSFIKKYSKTFKPCNGAWGRQGCTHVILEAASSAVIRSALLAAAKNLEVHAPKRPKAQ